MSQSKADSVIEVLVNTLIRAPINMLANEFIFPFFGYQITLVQNFGFMVFFTVLSLSVSYAIRRAFNGKPVYQTLRNRFLMQKEQKQNG